MVKILIGLVAAIVIAAGGFFGFERYMQHRVAGEVEAAFEQIRAAGGKASHGKVSFDLSTAPSRSRTSPLKRPRQPPASVKIASITASGVRQPDATRFAADTIEVTDIEVDWGVAAEPGARLTYKVPRITVKDYSGPTSRCGNHRLRRPSTSTGSRSSNSQASARRRSRPPASPGS